MNKFKNEMYSSLRIHWLMVDRARDFFLLYFRRIDEARTSKKWFCLLSFIYAAGGIKFVVHLSRPRPRQNLHHCV